LRRAGLVLVGQLNGSALQATPLELFAYLQPQHYCNLPCLLLFIDWLVVGMTLAAAA
jgi:hypothetical protein